MYPSETAVRGFTLQEQEIIHSVRILIGDEKATVIEEVDDALNCANVFGTGSIYQMENKGWPKKVMIEGVEFSNPLDPFVENYEYLVFSGSNVITDSVFVMYETFRFGDLQILDAFDFAGSSVLAAQCSLTAEQITQPLMNLAAAIVLIQGEYQKYAEQAVEMQDGDSMIDLVDRLAPLQRELESLRTQLERAIARKICCANYSLPVFRVE